MSHAATPPPGDDRPDPTSDPGQNPEAAPEGYGTPPPPPPHYGSAPQPPAPSAPSGPGTQGYADAPPPPPAQGGYPPPPPPAYGQQQGYGQQPAYGQQPGYGQTASGQEQPYGAAPAYAGPYDQGSQVGTLAQWPQRALGWLIDFVVLAIPGWILYWIGGPKVDTVTGTTTSPNFVYYLGVLYFLALYIYNRWYRGGTTGQTIGRGFAGVKLVSESTGQPIGPGLAFVRDLAHIVDSLICYVGWLFPLWDQKRQTLADKIMSTVVITAPKNTNVL